MTPIPRKPHDAGSHDQQMTPAVQAVIDAADKRMPGVAIRLTRDTRGMCVVWLCFDGKEVPVIQDNGDVISHYVEPLGIESAIRKAAPKEPQA